MCSLYICIYAAHCAYSINKWIKTRSSAIAEGPRDAWCQLKNCQLSPNSAPTTCTTSPEKIEIMKLEDEGEPICDKHVHSTTAFAINMPECELSRWPGGDRVGGWMDTAVQLTSGLCCYCCSLTVACVTTAANWRLVWIHVRCVTTYIRGNLYFWTAYIFSRLSTYTTMP